MRALIVYASAHGSTAEVARFMAEIWRKRGIETDVAAVGTAPSLAGYDAYALGRQSITDFGFLKWRPLSGTRMSSLSGSPCICG